MAGEVPTKRLSREAIQRLEDQIETSYGIGDRQFASDLRELLRFYEDAIASTEQK